MGASTFPEELAAIIQQLQNAQDISSEMPQTQMYGRTAVAPNPLQHVAHVMDKQRSNRSQRDAMAEYRALVETLRGARGAYGRGVAGVGQTPPIRQPIPSEELPY